MEDQCEVCGKSIRSDEYDRCAICRVVCCDDCIGADGLCDECRTAEGEWLE
ncbi:MAG: hypothetical protein ACYTEQ_31335 [Planctomycetota bacterium]|jgi:hypothetical protein